MNSDCRDGGGVKSVLRFGWLRMMPIEKVYDEVEALWLGLTEFTG